MEELWMVYDSEDGLICVGSYEECIPEYEAYKSSVSDHVMENGFECNERVILAKIAKDYRAVDTKEPHHDFNDPTSEFHESTYWDMKEEEYPVK